MKTKLSRAVALLCFILLIGCQSDFLEKPVINESSDIKLIKSMGYDVSDLVETDTHLYSRGRYIVG